MAASVDHVVEAVRTDLLRRSQLGIEKYGTTLDRTDLNLRDWLQHAYEEHLDAANYLKRAIIEMGATTIPTCRGTRLGWQPLTHIDGMMTCSMPADETVVEVMLCDGTTRPARYSRNLTEERGYLTEAGYGDFLPVIEADRLGAMVVAWRDAPIVATSPGREVLVKAQDRP